MKKRILRIFAIVGVCTTLSACSVLSSLADQAVGLANLANCEYNLKNVSNLTVAGVNVKNLTNGNITAGDVLKLTTALVSKAVPMAMNVNIDIKNPTTTNAALLTPERSRVILDAGLDRLNVSVEGMTAQQYREFSHAELDFDRFVENIAWFYDHRGGCELNVKINGDNLTSEQEQAFFATFGDICDGISVERTIDYWPKYNAMRVDYDESVTLLGGKSREVQVCPYVFYEMCVNSDGTFSLCRFDWNHAMLLDRHVGAPPTLKKIWDSIVLWNFQQRFLSGERLLLTVLSCPKCGLLKQGVPEDLDAFAAEILDRM